MVLYFKLLFADSNKIQFVLMKVMILQFSVITFFKVEQIIVFHSLRKVRLLAYAVGYAVYIQHLHRQWKIFFYGTLLRLRFGQTELNLGLRMQTSCSLHSSCTAMLWFDCAASIQLRNIVVFRFCLTFKVEKTLKGSLNSSPSPSVKIQIMGGKVCLRCKGNAMFRFSNYIICNKAKHCRTIAL